MGLFLLFTVVLAILFYAIYLLVLKDNIQALDFYKKPKVMEGIVAGFDEIYIDISDKKHVLAYVLLMITVLIVLFFLSVNLLVGAIVLAAMLAFPFVMLNILKKRRLALFEKQLPDAIDLMAGSLRSGSSLVGALALIAEEFPRPLSDEIGLMVREQKLGVSMDESLQNFARRMPYNSVILTTSVIRTSIETGGELSDALKNIAKTLRNIEQAEGKIRALTAQGKMQAWVVGLMPVLLIIVLSKMEPAAMSQLWSTNIGYMALAAIIIFEVLGILFIRKIVSIDI